MKVSEYIAKKLSLRLSLKVFRQVAVLLTVAVAVLLYFSRQALYDEARQNAEQMLEGTVQQIDNVLLSVEQTAGNIYWEVLAHLDQPELMTDYCRRVVECNPYVVGCAVAMKPGFYPTKAKTAGTADDNGLFMTYVCRPHGLREGFEVTDTFTNRPYTEQVWYTKPVSTGSACWTDPLKGDDTEYEPLTSFCLPLYDSNRQCVGVIAADLPIALFSQIVLAVKPSPNGYCTLLGSDGSFIVHPDTAKLTHQTVFTQTMSGADPSVRKAAEAMVKGESGFMPFRMNGQDMYVLFKPFNRIEMEGRATEKLGWSVGVVYPDDDIFGGFTQLLYIVVGFAAVGLLVFFLLLRLVTHRQLLPLRQLTHSAQRIAEGHYNEPVHNARSNDEIGQLQKHFQQMQQSLAQQIDEQQRLTATLQEHCESLSKAYRKAQEADRMKTSFLHYVTNQMTAPADAIDQSVAKLCDNYESLSRQEVEHEADVIEQQSAAIISLVNDMLHAADKETGKEGHHE